MSSPATTSFRFWYRWPSRIALMGLVVLAGVSPRDPPSIWRHLSVGRAIAQHGLPLADPFTVLGADRPWANPTWFFDAAAYLAYAGGGAYAMLLLRLFLVACVAFALASLPGSPRKMFRANPPHSSTPLPSPQWETGKGELYRVRAPGLLLGLLVVPLAILALREAFALTPVLAGLLCLAALSAWIGSADRYHPWSSLLRLFLVQAAWANLDNHFILGPLVGLCWWAGSLIDRWWCVGEPVQVAAGAGDRARESPVGQVTMSSLVAVATAAGSLASPYGLNGWRASWIECSAMFRIGAEGQAMVSGLVPIWAGGLMDLTAVTTLALLLGALVAGLWPAARCRSLLPTVALGALVVADRRFAPFGVVWFVRAMQFTIVDWRTRVVSPLVPAANQVRADEERSPNDQGADATRSPIDRESVAPRSGPLGSRGQAAIVGALLIVIMLVATPFVRQVPQAVARMRRDLSSDSTIGSRLKWLETEGLGGAVLPLHPMDGGWLEFGGSRLRPLLDDRIELFGQNYATYRRLCRDVVDDRHNAYRLTDGSLGGWRPPHNLVPFRWVISQVSDMETNTQLGSSSFWAPAYWDAEVVIFGMKQESQVSAAAQRLGELDRVIREGAMNGRGAADYRLDSEMKRWDKVSRQGEGQEALLGVANLMLAMGYPYLARFYLERVDAPRLRDVRDRLNGLCARFGADRSPFSLQDASAAHTRPPPVASIAAIDQQFAVESYAGSGACAGCHRQQASDFAETAHARALFRAETDAAAHLLAGRSSPEPHAEAGHSRISFQSKGGRLWAESDTESSVESVPIEWCFGSGEFGVTFVTLLQDPLGRSRLLEHHWSWFRDGDVLALTPGHAPSGEATGFARFGDVNEPTTTRLCFSCHATAFVYGGGRLDADSVVPGIQCERCHGPRNEHVAVKMRSTSQSATAAQPRQSARQQVYACGECHRRPEEINDEIRPDNPIIARFPSVGLVQSKCFLATESKGTLTCITCHDPHRAARPPASFYDGRCNDCHSLTRNRNAIPCSANPGDRSCVGCHMQKVRLHEHLQFTDHWIRRGS